MEPRTEAIYNKNIALTTLIGILASLLLSIHGGSFSPLPIYGGIIFMVIMFIECFLTNHFLAEQDPALFILACFIVQLGLIML